MVSLRLLLPHTHSHCYLFRFVMLAPLALHLALHALTLAIATVILYKVTRVHEEPAVCHHCALHCVLHCQLHVNHLSIEGEVDFKPETTTAPTSVLWKTPADNTPTWSPKPHSPQPHW